MADTSLSNGECAGTMPDVVAAGAASSPSPSPLSLASLSLSTASPTNVSLTTVSDDDALFHHATRKYLQDKLIENAKLSFLQLSQLDDSSTRFTHLDAVLRDLYTAGLYDIQVLLSFLEALPNWHWTLDGVVVLHRVDVVLQSPAVETAAHLPTLPLAFFLHKLMSHLEGSVKVRAESYWYEWVPPTIRAVVMGRDIVIESVARRELVYAPSRDFCFDSDRRNVFSWRKAWTPDADKERWRLVPATAQKDRFYLQSVHCDEFLYAADYAKFRRDAVTGAPRSRVFLWRKAHDVPGESGHWQLVTLGATDDRDVFCLYNPYQKEFLYAPDDVYDGERRHVLTTRHRANDPNWTEQRKWRLSAADSCAVEQGIEAFFRKQYPEAVAQLTLALVELPDHTQHVKCYAYRMTANLRMGHVDAIAADVAAIAALGGDKAALFHGLAHLWDESVAFLALQAATPDGPLLSPFAVQHQMARGDFFFVRKQFGEAVACYHAVAMDHGTTQPSVSSTHDSVDVNTSNGDNVNSATAAVTVNANDDDSETMQQRATAYLRCGKCFFALHEVENASQYLAIGLALPNLALDIEAQLLLWLSKCRRQQQQHDEALKLLEKAFDCASAAAAASALPSLQALKQTIVLDIQVVTILKRELYTSLLSPCDSVDSSHNGELDANGNGTRANDSVKSAEKTLTHMMELFQCPLSLELMQDPVMTPNGDTYERAMIERHLDVNGHFDPLTRAPLVKDQLYPNRALKVLMETMLSDHRLGLLLASCST